MNVAERGRLLIVEPDPSILRSYSTELTRAGFNVEEASKGIDALRRIEREHFDLLISDLKMPDMNGLDLLRRIRERSVYVQTVLLLDNPDNQIVVKAVQLGALQYLVKPIKAELLVKAALAVARRNPARVPGNLEIASVTGKPIFTATEAKNKFAEILEKAIRGESVVITKHHVKKAVLVSMDEFEALSRASESKINTLSAEFDSLLARMQGPEARKAMDAAFHASPKELGLAAVAVARKRG